MFLKICPEAKIGAPRFLHSEQTVGHIRYSWCFLMKLKQERACWISAWNAEALMWQHCYILQCFPIHRLHLLPGYITDIQVYLVTNFHFVKSHFIWTEFTAADWAQLFSVSAFLSHANQKNITSHRKVCDRFTNEELINTQHVWKKKTGHFYMTVVRKESQSFHWWVDDVPTGRIPAGTSV